MKTILVPGLTLLFLVFAPAFAFDTVDEQINHYLDILENGSLDSQVEMLERLQWSGLSDRRLFDPIEQVVRFKAIMSSSKNMKKAELARLSHMIRALGYSGNEHYRNMLNSVRDFSKNRKLSGHAKKAAIQLDDFKDWHSVMARSQFKVESKPVEIQTYMRMLDTDHVMVQRLAARAIFHERRKDDDLLTMAAKKLERLYNRPGLGREGQDTAAWLVKAVGEYGSWQHENLLSRVAKDSPYKSVRKHAKKYAR